MEAVPGSKTVFIRQAEVAVIVAGVKRMRKLPDARDDRSGKTAEVSASLIFFDELCGGDHLVDSVLRQHYADGTSLAALGLVLQGLFIVAVPE